MDREIRNGLLALLAVAGAIALDVYAVHWWHADPTLRVVVPLVATIAAVSFASTNWLPRTLRWTAVLGIGLIAATLFSIGRDTSTHQVADDAEAELVSIDEATTTAALTIPDAMQDRLDALTTSAAALRSAITSVPDTPENSTLRAEATAVAAAVEKHDKAGAHQHAKTFTSVFPAEAAPVLDALNSAVTSATAALDSFADRPSPVLVRRSVADACASINAAEPTHRCTFGATRNPVDDVPVAMAKARLQLAQLRADIFGREVDTTARDAAAKALAAAQATSPEWKDPQLTVGDAIMLGVDEVVSGDRAVGEAGPVQDLEPWAWVLLGVLALTFWRWIERRSARQLPGPVELDFTAFAEKDATSSDPQGPTFKSAVLRNISAPAAVPGSTALTSLSDLAELVAPTGWIGTIGKALKNAVGAPPGYLVHGDTVPPVADDGEWRVLVRVTDQSGRNGQIVASIAGKSAQEAARAAGYWAAAAVLEQSARIPSWTRWTPESSQAMAAYDDSLAVGGSEIPSTELENAVALAPDSGVLLHRWADRCDLDGHRLEALSSYARAVAAHPRFPIARYRFTVSLAMLSRTPEVWIAATASDRYRIAGQLRRAGVNLRLPDATLDTIAHLPEIDDETELTTTLGAVAARCFAKLKGRRNWARVLWMGLRKSERDVYLPPGLAKFGQGSTRKRAVWLVRSAAITSPDGHDFSKVVERARLPRSSWQLSYNLACLYATARTPEALTACRWLETALERPGSGAMAGGWLGTDPDLKRLRGTPRFDWITSQVDDSRKVDRSDG